MEKIRIFQKYNDIEISRAINPAPNNATFERHCHSRYELLYVLDGKGSYIVEGAEYPLLPHTLFLLRPYEYHYLCPDRGHTYDRFVIYFESGTLSPPLSHHALLTESGGNFFALSEQESPIRSAFEALGGIVSLSQGGTGATPEAEALLRASIVQILLLLTKETPHPPTVRDGGTIRAIIDYLNQHLYEELSLDEIAKEFYISKYHLCRIFKEQTGATLFSYYNTKRMALAQQMIARGDNATAVALRLGFSDYSTFYRAYRKYTGESPRRKIQERE